MTGKIYVKNRLQKSTIFVKTYRNIKRILLTTRRFIFRMASAKNKPETLLYQEYFMNNQLDKSCFVDLTSRPYSGKKSKKLIAYYLPQFYQIPQNDSWFGRGFTEWSNATKAVPQFINHWQPHLPIDVGFYSLESTHTMYRQVELAKMYGLSGFCFYYYWFSGGEKIMEKPIQNWLEDKRLNFPFMFFWANEDWTNTWGNKGDFGTKTFSAKMKPEDVEKFVEDIVPYMKDDRYIKIDGRPHLIIYQAKKDPYLRKFIEKVGKNLAKNGVQKPYISLVFPDDFDTDFNPIEFGADAAVEFGAHMKVMPDTVPQSTTLNKIMNTKAKITEYDMKGYICDSKYIFETDYPVFKGVMTYFDNTARKIYTGAELFSIPPHLYQKWLEGALEASDTDQVFIAAWNEWAEGMHLEPDHKYGYSYLQATKNALEKRDRL